jgi:hypothetical protein
MHYLALCCVAKDEDPFLKEWLAFHALLGVEHFYIYDNMSKTPIAELLEGFADPGRVTVRRIAGKAVQCAVYQDCLDAFGPSCVWLGFIDIDEFICPMEDRDLRVFLSEFEGYGGLGVSWDMFSSSGHIARPIGPVIRNYTQRLLTPRENIHYKTILRPARTQAACNPHVFLYPPGTLCVTEDHCPIPPDAPFAFSRRRRIKLNHYFYRSRQDYEEKLARGRADTGSRRPVSRSMEAFAKQAAAPHEEDGAILRYLPALEKALSANRLPGSGLHLPGDEPLFKYMDAASALAEAGQMEKASLCLTAAIPRFENAADLWITRALFARLCGRYDRAERFIHRALALEETPNGYLELIALRTAQKRYQEAGALQEFLRHLIAVRTGR